MKRNEPISLAFVGDVAPTCEYERSPQIFRDALVGIRSKAKPDTICCVNLECSFGSHMKSCMTHINSENTLACFETLKPVVVNVANNHIFDSGVDSFRSIYAILSKYNIPVVGVYKPDETFNIVELFGLRVAFVCRVAEGTNPKSWGSEGYFIHRLDPAELLATCELARKTADVLIVSVHWGAEYYTQPSPKQQELVRALIEEDVDIVWGHHAHVLQPRFLMNEKLVMYSLGNFVFGTPYPGHWPKASGKASLVLYDKGPAETKVTEICSSIGANGVPQWGDVKLLTHHRNSPRKISGIVAGMGWTLRRFYMEFFWFGARRLWKYLRRDTPYDGQKNLGAKGLGRSLQIRLKRILRPGLDE